MTMPLLRSLRPHASLPRHPARRTWLTRTSAVATAALLAGCGHVPFGPGKGPSVARLRGHDHVLLGEIHDNPDHHAARAALLTALLADGRPTVVLFEMVGRRHDEALAREVARQRSDGLASPSRRAEAADAVAQAGALDRRGWGWPLHRPLFEAALAGGAELRGANLEPDEARAAVRTGLDALPEDVRAAITADTTWDDARQAEALRLIDQGHCGLLPSRLHAPMVLAQRGRDVAMALAMRRAATALAGTGAPMPGAAPRRAVLVAGNGHVRRDLGVPHALVAMGVAASSVVAVGYLEPDQPATGFDLVEVAPPPPGRPDPCEGLRRRT